MISGVTVTVLRPTAAGPDRFGNEARGGDAREEVDGVLVVPGAAAELEASRPEGAAVAFTLHFPKGYGRSLAGCAVELPEPWEGAYRVVGDPHPYMDENTPGRWSMPVEVEAAHG